MNNKCTVFIIPNSDNHGAQNFFKRLHKSIKIQKKFLLVEEGFSIIENIKRISAIKEKSFLTLVCTVNSIKLGIIYRLLFPNTKLILRLGNTISREVNRRSIKYYFIKFFYLLGIKLSSHFIFQSHYMKEDFLFFFNLQDHPKLKVIHNGVPRANKIEMGNSIKEIFKEKINFLLVGSFKPQKGYDILFDALKNLDSYHQNICHFHICGDGEEFNFFKKNILKENLDNFISLYGNISPNNLYSHADAYILPSKFEGFSNSLIEALSFGLPSIVSDCPSGNREIIKENFNGIIFKNLDSVDLIKKIIFMVENLDKFNGSLIQIDTERRFLIDNISIEYQEIIG